MNIPVRQRLGNLTTFSAVVDFKSGISNPSFCHSEKSLCSANEAKCIIGTSTALSLSFISTSSESFVSAVASAGAVFFGRSTIFWMIKSRSAFSDASFLACVFEEPKQFQLYNFIPVTHSQQLENSCGSTYLCPRNEHC